MLLDLGACRGALVRPVAPTLPEGGIAQLRTAIGSEPQTLDSGLCTETICHEIIANLFAGLVELDPDTLEPIPELAERWELDPSGTHYTFYLRRARWSDVEPITAQDVVFSWQRAVDPNFGSRGASILAPIVGARAALAGVAPATALGVRAEGDRIVHVELVRRAPYFLQLLAQPIMRPVPRHKLAALVRAGIAESQWVRPEHMVTSGPFMLESWRFKRDIKLRKSAGYFDRDRVALEQVTYTIVESGSTLINLYLSGELDWTGSNSRLPSAYLTQLQKRPDFVSEPLLTSSFYWLNCAHPQLRDARVRRALSLAIDREAITKGLLRGGEVPWAGLVPPGLAGYPRPQVALFDPIQARTLWQAAQKDAPIGPVRLALSYNTEDSHRLVAEAVQAMWSAHLGIDVELYNEEWQVFLHRVEQRDFDIARLGWVGDFADPISFLRDVVGAEAGNNASGWRDQRFEDKLREADETPDAAARLARLADAEADMLAAQPLIPLFASSHGSLVRPDVCGLGRNILGQHPLKHIWRAQPGAFCATGRGSIRGAH